MNMDERNLTYDQFKADILHWKNTHREEYNRFARLMTNGDERQYLDICKAIFRQLPRIKTEWELCWDDDSKGNFENIDLMFKEDAVPKRIVELYHEQREESNPLHDTAPATLWDRIKSIFSSKPEEPRIILSAPLVLSWLYYGKSFEAMVSMVSKQAGSPEADEADRQSCSFVTRQIISVSIKSGFRTRADWDEYFAMNEAIKENRIGEWALQSATNENVTNDMTDEPEQQQQHTTKQANTEYFGDMPINDAPKSRGRQKAKEMPLVNYLNCANKDIVIDIIRKFISKYDTAAEQALTYYALNELGLLTDIGSAKEYATALIIQFDGVGGIKSESSYRQAIHLLTTTQHVMKNGVNRMCVMLNGDSCQTLLSELKAELAEAVNR
jgi:hypothetical protein